MGIGDTIYRKGETLFRESGEIAILLVRGLLLSGELWRGRERFLVQLNRIGVETLPLVLMIGLFTGLVVALQTGIELQRQFGAEEHVGAIVAVSLVREMGPVITAFILAGRVGSSIAAEIGTMAVSEEVDALRSMGINPVGFLFVPRLFAMVIMQPVLTAFSVAIGLWGGALVAASYLNYPAAIYYNRAFEALRVDDIIDGFSKTFVFAVLIATISVHVGLSTRHGAVGVGQSTTRAVVLSLSTVLIADYLITALLA